MSGQDDPEQLLRDLIAGQALPVSENQVFVPDPTTTYVGGTTVPLLGMRTRALDPGSGFWKPDSDPAHYDYIGTYITLAEYYPPDQLPADGDRLLASLADLEDRHSIIGAIAAINEISKRPGGMETLTAQYRDGLEPGLLARFDAAMREEGGGLGRQVVAPQPVLLALRWLLGRVRAERPSTAPRDPRDTHQVAMAFCHAIGGTLRDPDLGTPELTQEAELRLMLAMMNLGSLGEGQDVFSTIDRTTRLWNQYGHLAIAELGATAADLLEQVAGISVGDVLAVGFALLAHIRGWEPGKPLLLNREISPSTPAEMLDRVLKLIGVDFPTAQETFGDALSEFDLLAIEAHPVLIEQAGMLVLDQDLLWRRCTSGLYWVVHDGLKAQRGDAERHLWTKAYAAMVEAMTEDAMRPLAPPVLASTASTFYTEEDFEKAYGTIARSDIGIDFGDSFLLVEVVSGQLTTKSRVEGDLVKLEKDFDRLVLDKCRQLDSIASALLADEEPLTGIPAGVRHPTFVPAVVVGGGFPLNFLSYKYIRTKLNGLGYLEHARISPLAVLDLGDVEALEGLGERGHSPADILIAWQKSDLRDLTLHNFLIREGLLADGSRPARMQATVDAAFSDVIARLGLTPDNGSTA